MKKNATAATVNAGYSSRSASSLAYQLLQNPIVQEYLEMRDEQSIEEYRKIIRVAVGRWLQNLKDGEIRLNSVSDLKVLIEADLMLKDIER